MSQASQIPLPNLREWLQRETSQTIEPLRSKGESLLNEIRERLDEAVKASEKFTEKSEREIQKGSPKTYRRAKLANKFSRDLAEALKRVVVPDQLSYASLQTLHVNFERMQATVDQQRRLFYPHISPYFILDRRMLDVHLKRTADILQELRNFLTQKYAKAKTADDALAEVDKLHQSLAEAAENESRIKQLELRERFLENQLAENQQRMGLIQGKVELAELVKTNQKTEELRESVKHSLRHLQKPFFKLQSLARSAEVALPLDEAKKLSDYLNDPFEALATEEEGHPVLKRILRRVDEAINQGRLKLKSSRLRKAQEQIDSVLDRNALLSLQQSCTEAHTLRKQLLASQTVASSQNELAQLQTERKELQRRFELVTSRKAALIGEGRRLQEKIEQQKKELEKMVFQLTNKTVQIIST